MPQHADSPADVFAKAHNVAVGVYTLAELFARFPADAFPINDATDPRVVKGITDSVLKPGTGVTFTKVDSDADGVPDTITVNSTGGGSGTVVGSGLITAVTASGTTTISTTATQNSPDATLLARANHTGTQSADTVTDGTSNKAYTAAEKTKLANVAANSTANATDASLRDRTTHTGTQLAATISDFAQAMVDNRGYFLSSLNYSLVILIDPVTHVWPARTLPTGYTLGFVTWDSQSDPGAPAPPNKQDQDFWDERLA